VVSTYPPPRVMRKHLARIFLYGIFLPRCKLILAVPSSGTKQSMVCPPEAQISKQLSPMSFRRSDKWEHIPRVYKMRRLIRVTLLRLLLRLDLRRLLYGRYFHNLLLTCCHTLKSFMYTPFLLNLSSAYFSGTASTVVRLTNMRG